MNTTPDTLLTPDNIQVGRYVYEVLVTDTVIYKIIKQTAKTITIRQARDKQNEDGLPMTLGTYPYIRTAQTDNLEGRAITLRARKDGTYRISNYRGVRSLRYAELDTFEDGNEYPSRYVDYSF